MLIFQAIFQVVGSHPNPRAILSQLGIAKGIQDVLLEQFKKRETPQ